MLKRILSVIVMATCIVSLNSVAFAKDLRNSDNAIPSQLSTPRSSAYDPFVDGCTPIIRGVTIVPVTEGQVIHNNKAMTFEPTEAQNRVKWGSVVGDASGLSLQKLIGFIVYTSWSPKNASGVMITDPTNGTHSPTDSVEDMKFVDIYDCYGKLHIEVSVSTAYGRYANFADIRVPYYVYA